MTVPDPADRVSPHDPPPRLVSALRDRARDLLADARVLVGPDTGSLAGPVPELSSLHHQIEVGLRRLDEPMRVAVTGQIKKGKSTLVNAMLGERLAPTGNQELTFNVCDIGYGPLPGLTIHFADGRPSERMSIDDLEVVATRRGDQSNYLAAVRMIEVSYPSPLLRTFRLVDTPGLNSFYDADSRNTLAFLGRDPQTVEAASEHALGQADAVVHLFSRGLHADDLRLAEELRGPVSRVVTPLTAVAVLTRCDEYWPPPRGDRDRPDPLTDDPLALGGRIAAGLLDVPAVNRAFYAVKPVSGLLGVGGPGVDSGPA